MTSSIRKSSLIWIGLIVVFCLLMLIPALWCWQTIRVFIPTRAPESFPDTDIVYNGALGLGFVNADGTSVSTLPVVYGYTDLYRTSQSPLITGDGKTVFVTFASVPGYPGKIYAVPAGEKPVDCGWDGTIQLAADGSHILISGMGDGIHKYLPEDCGTGNPPAKVYSGIFNALSPDEQYVAYSIDVKDDMGNRESTILLRHIPNGEKRVVGVGDFPVWSRDGKWLAYTGVDGIYILRISPNAESTRLVSLQSPEPNLSVPPPVYQEYRIVEYYPPIASWSPDGQWLVYHVYSSDLVDPEAGAWAGHYSIFKVNVDTGKTTKLLDGGYSPFWRWSVEGQ